MGEESIWGRKTFKRTEKHWGGNIAEENIRRSTGGGKD